MKKRTVTLMALLALFLTPVANAEWGTTSNTSGDAPQYEVGIDVEMPYIIDVAGTSVNSTGNTLLGIHGNYYATNAWTLGLQFDFGIETSPGADNTLMLSPGTAYHMMPQQTFDPYIRLDIPLVLNNNFDYGVSAGVGLLWNLGDMTGVEGLGLKYDFTASYFIDTETFALNLFRFAVAYNW